MTSETVTAWVTGIGILIAAGIGVASMFFTAHLQKISLKHNADLQKISMQHAEYLQKIERRNEQARRIGDWLSKIASSVGEAITLPEMFESILTTGKQQDFSKITLGLVQQCHKGQIVCSSLINEKVVIMSTSTEIKDAGLGQAINDVEGNVKAIAQKFIEYRDKSMMLAPTGESPSALTDSFIPEMHAKADLMKKSCDIAVSRLKTFLSDDKE